MSNRLRPDATGIVGAGYNSITLESVIVERLRTLTRREVVGWLSPRRPKKGGAGCRTPAAGCRLRAPAAASARRLPLPRTGSPAMPHPPHARAVAALAARLDTLHDRLDAVLKGAGQQPRWPKGSPRGGQWKDGGAGQGGVDRAAFATGAGTGAAPKGAKPKVPTDAAGHPLPLHPTAASGPETWSDPQAVAVFTRTGGAPTALHGVPLEPWTTAPRTEAEWAVVEGQDPTLDAGWPLRVPKGKHAGAGVIVREPDGRVWVVEPTNHFGGYKATFPKGTAEPGIPSLQANAIKEAWEESGLKVRITGVLGDVERDTSVARYYLAERVGGTPREPSPTSTRQAAACRPPGRRAPAVCVRMLLTCCKLTLVPDHG